MFNCLIVNYFVGLLLTKEDTEPSVPIGQIEVITLFDRRHHDWSTATKYMCH